MIIDRPQPGDIPALRRLWKQAFGDTDAFLDSFFAVGFSPDRCRCLWGKDTLAAALYWFDCSWEQKPIAYLYGVATDENYRGRGLCRALMEDTHNHLRACGYEAAVLVPGTKDLFSLYEKMGYQTFGYVQEFSCEAGGAPLPVEILTAEAYAKRRTAMLPAGAILQEGVLLDFFQTQGAFYAGQDLLLAATITGDILVAQEYLGDPGAVPGILMSLGVARGQLRSPGKAKPFAMCHNLQKQNKMPEYFAIALD